MRSSSIEKLTQAQQWLAEAKTLDDVKHIIDIAEAARVYARAAKLGLEAYNDAAEVKVRAERKAGEMLAQLERSQGGDSRLFQAGTSASEYRQVLDENNIPTTTAFRWQQMSKLPDERFEEIVQEVKIDRPITSSGILKEIRTNEINNTRAKLAEKGKQATQSQRWNIWQADIKTWQAPRQYDFIITDPPYPKEYLYLYETLAQRAVEWLKPGGLLIAMAGQSYLNVVYALLSKYLTYYWTAAYFTPGQPTPLRQRNVNTTWKPLLMFCADDYKGKIFGDVFKSGGNDKDFHRWGQSVSGMYDIISKIVLPGQYILDPFCGAGTTGVAALEHGCFFDGLELDNETANIARSRIYDTATKR